MDSIQFSETPLSVTKVSKLFEDIKMAQIVNYLIKEEYLINAGNYTDKGEELGICMTEYTSNGKTTRYPVYTKAAQIFLASHLDEIRQMSTEATWRPKREKKEKMPLPEYVDVDVCQEENRGPFHNFVCNDFVVLDTETTGLNAGQDEVVEVGIVDMRGNVLYSSTFYPEVEVGFGAQQVNHLNKQVLAGSPYFKDEWENIKAIIGGRKILGHNIGFDYNMIKGTLRRYGLDEREADLVFARNYDSMNIAKRWIKAKSYSLENLSHMVYISGDEKHRAADDCILTIKMLYNLDKIIDIRKKYDFIRL